MQTCMFECNNLYEIKFELSKNIHLLEKQLEHPTFTLKFNCHVKVNESCT